MNTGTAMLDMIRRHSAFTHLHHTFKRFTTGINDDAFIHISHNDLDGVGCTAISRYFCNCNIARRDGYRAFINTDNIAGVLNVLDNAITEYCASSYFKKFVAKPFVNILITDIGSIDIMELVKALSNRVGDHIPYFNVIVVDHHQSKYLTGFSHKDVISTLINLPDGSKEYIGAYNDNEVSVRYYINTGISATASLSTFMTDVFNPDDDIYYRMLEFACLVSMYDTGNFGEWRCDDHHPYDMMSLQAKLFYLWKHTGADYGKLVDTFISQINEETSPYGDENALHGIIHNEAVNATNLYNAFVQRLQLRTLRGAYTKATSYTIPIRDYNNRQDKDINVEVPEIYLTGKECDIVVLFSRTAEEAGFAFSLYSKMYLEEHPDVMMMLHIINTDDDHRVELRSGTNGWNCYEVATLNGGGGHPRAAGFRFA